MTTAIDNELKIDVYGRTIPSPIPFPGTGTGGGVTPRIPSPFPWRKPIPINTRDIATNLDAFLKPNEPKVVQWLYSTWNAQEDALKYQEFRNALLGLTPDGAHVPQALLDHWRETYAATINEQMVPVWRNAIVAGAENIARNFLNATDIPFSFTLEGSAVNTWIVQHGVELAKELTDTQAAAMSGIIQHFTITEPVGSRTLSRYLRPLMTLTERETGWVINKRAALAKEGLTGTNLDRKVIDYSHFLERRRAERIARTELATAHNMGKYEAMVQQEARANAAGYVTTKRWSVHRDERLCDFCSALDGKEIGLRETFPNAAKGENGEQTFSFAPPAHPNCLTSNTDVIAENIVGGTIRRFNGAIITLFTTDGSQLSVTENHPILTNRGWVSAGELNKRDEVITCDSGQVIAGMSESDDVRVITGIKKFARSLLMTSSVRWGAMPASAEDFHGDVTDDNISIVWAYGDLPAGIKPLTPQEVRDYFLSDAVILISEVAFALLCAVDKLFATMLHAASRIMRGFSKGLSFCRGQFTHSDRVCFATVSAGDFIIGQDSRNSGAINVDSPRDGQLTLPAGIRVDNIIDNRDMAFSEVIPQRVGHYQFDAGLFQPSVDSLVMDIQSVADFSDRHPGVIKATGIKGIVKRQLLGHVFNLQTRNGWYAANSIITHNCRCVIAYQIEPVSD